jgi:hypothetical protein
MYMPVSYDKSWELEKENLKLQFEALANKYVVFEGSDTKVLPGKLQHKPEGTKERMQKIISAM